MPVTNDINALSASAASNSPAGTEDRTTADDYLRQVHAFIATLRDGKLATGGQIPFPATQNASSNANTLDDYEEGAWTPTVSAASGSITSYTSSGKYTKVGNKVSASIEITITTKGTASSLMSISMPFTSSGAHAATGVEISSPAGFGLAGWMNNSSTTLSMFKHDGYTPFEGDGDQFVISITYLT